MAIAEGRADYIEEPKLAPTEAEAEAEAERRLDVEETVADLTKGREMQSTVNE